MEKFLSFTFTAWIFDDKERQNLEDLVEQLTKDNYSVIIKYDVAKKGAKEAIVHISCDTGKLRIRRTRNAGRYKSNSGHSCREVFQYRQDHTQAETAKWLQMPMRTYQRREAAAKRDGFWENTDVAETGF